MVLLVCERLLWLKYVPMMLVSSFSLGMEFRLLVKVTRKFNRYCLKFLIQLHRLQLLWLNARPEWLLKILKRPDESDLAPCMRQLGRCWQSKLSNQKTVASKDSVVSRAIS